MLFSVLPIPTFVVDLSFGVLMHRVIKEGDKFCRGLQKDESFPFANLSN